MANEFRIKNGLHVQGPITTDGNITASLQGTASFAVSASWAPGGAAFPYTGSAGILGSLLVNGNMIQGNTINTATGLGAHAEGFGVIASGPYSHAEGQAKTQTISLSSWMGLGWNGTNYFASNPSLNNTGSFFTGGDRTGDFPSVPTTATTFGVNFTTIPGVTPTITAVTYDSGNNRTQLVFSPVLEPSYTIIQTSNTAAGTGSHAEGYGNNASGSFSHAEGDSTTAIGVASHAEGNVTYAVGGYSHAEGVYSNAVGDYSHAEGTTTQALGFSSHAEGNATIANGLASHAEGLWTIAVSDYQHVQGAYNLPVSGASAFILGNGGGNGGNTRSNLIFASGSVVQITGSTDILGSLFLNGTEITGGGAAFPYTGSATISGSLAVDGPITFGIANGLNQPQQTSNILTFAASGTQTLIDTRADENAVFIDYVVVNDSNIRAGVIVAASDQGAGKVMTETATTDIGDTSAVTFAVNVTGGTLAVTCTTSTTGWVVKTIIRTI